jgi:hypothetical protein
MSGFYVTLPSNSSMDIYPNNKQSSFKTKLAKEINFPDNYEVALVEISYSPFFISYMGNILLKDYFDYHYGSLHQTIQIPLNIVKSISSKDYFEIINKQIEIKIEFDDSLIRYKSYFLKSTAIEIENAKKYYINSKDNLFLDFFKTTELNSNFRFIDDLNSQFKDDFLKISGDSFNHELKKWEFTLAQLFTLNRKYKLRIYLVNLNYNLENINKFFSFEDIELLKKTEIKDKNFNPNKIFSIKNQLKNKLGLIQLEINGENGSFVDYLDYPKFIYDKQYDSRKSILKITQDPLAKNDMIFVEGKIANSILEKENGLVNRNQTYIIDTIFNQINYAVINTDIQIENQFFVDYIAPFVKIFPLKSNTDSVLLVITLLIISLYTWII